MIDVEIQGLAETQARLERLLTDVDPGDGLRAVFAGMTLRAHRYATGITHVITGRLKNSHFPRVRVRGNEIYGVVGTNVAYAKAEHDRGGSHAFYDRVVAEDGPGIVAQAEADIAGMVRRAGA